MLAQHTKLDQYPEDPETLSLKGVVPFDLQYFSGNSKHLQVTDMKNIFISSGSFFALVGIVARSLSSHTIQPFLIERGKLDNFNLAADYLIVHGLALLVVAILCHLFPDARYERAGYLLIVGSLLFQGTVLIKSCVSIAPFGLLTPIGGLILMLGWGFLMFIPLFHTP